MTSTPQNPGSADEAPRDSAAPSASGSPGSAAPASQAAEPAAQPAGVQPAAEQPAAPAPVAPETGPAYPASAAPASGSAYPGTGTGTGSGTGSAPQAGGVPPAFGQTAPQPSAQPAPAAGSRSLGPMVAMLAVGALIGGAAGGGIAAWALGDAASDGTRASSPASVTVNDPEDATVVTGVVARAMPSVVTIEVQGGGTAGSGSGVIISEDGYVITNSHVATLDGAAADPELRVTASDGRIYDAELIGADPIADLAVIQLTDAAGLQPIEFADSGDLNVGDRAIAIGAPLGLAGTVTDGIVSALNRSITVQSSAVPEQQAPEDAPQETPDGTSPFDFWNFDFDIPGQDEGTAPRATQTISLSVIQTDAAINPGNSGGALLDDEGRLIGINVAIASAGGSQGAAGSIGVGFSIPANFAQRIADEIIETGAASHGLLGASVSEVEGTSDVVGALIREVTPAGAAEQAGLRAGDVITAFDGVPITSSIDLTAQVRVLAGGSSADVEYVRDGRSETAAVTLGELG